MKLYRGKITVIAQELVQRLIDEGDVEVDPTMKAEAEMDIQSIMLSYLKFRALICRNVSQRDPRTLLFF